MAFKTFILRPSADIHLILTDPVLQLEVIGFDDSVSIPPITNSCTYTIEDAAVADVSTTGLLQAIGEGVTFLTVEYIDSGILFSLGARIWVHSVLNNIYLGNNSSTVHEGSDDFQLTLYGEFSNTETPDIDLEDITGHPYASYRSYDPGLADVDPNGRVTGVAFGNTDIEVTDTINGQLVGVLNIEIRDSLVTDRPLVERVSFRSYGIEKKNILFLAEGFIEEEYEKFKEIVTRIDWRMRNSSLHQPFKLLTDDYNTWMAFEPSNEAGITHLGSNYGINIEDESPSNPGNYSLYDLINLVGLPTAKDKTNLINLADAINEWQRYPTFDPNKLEADMLINWLLSDSGQRAIIKDCTLGMMYGLRLGDRFASTSNLSLGDNKWFLSQPAESDFFYRDQRRISSNLIPSNQILVSSEISQNWKNDFCKYLNSLCLKNSDATDPNYKIGRKWNIDGSDQGLVIVIVNDDVAAGNYQGTPNVFAAASVGNKNRTDPGSKILLPPDSLIVDHTPSTSKYDIEPLTAVAVHELCHGIDLGDEYENTRTNGKSSPGNQFEKDITELSHNLSVVDNINASGCKWNVLFRVDKSSSVLYPGIVMGGLSSNEVKLTLFPGEINKWSLFEDAVLISKNINPFANFDFYSYSNRHAVFAIAGFIKDINTGTNEITFHDASPPLLQNLGVVPAGSMLYFPKMHNGSALSIVLPGVQTYLNNGTGNLPNGQLNIDRFFSSKAGNCTNPRTFKDGLATTPYPINDVSISSFKKHTLIGMHEGGGSYNCDVVRPTAKCKMRSQYIDGYGHFRFCHLCKYIIVQQFNPSRHSELDADYPGEPT